MEKSIRDIENTVEFTKALKNDKRRGALLLAEQKIMLVVKLAIYLCNFC